MLSKSFLIIFMIFLSFSCSNNSMSKIDINSSLSNDNMGNCSGANGDGYVCQNIGCKYCWNTQKYIRSTAECPK